MNNRFIDKLGLLRPLERQDVEALVQATAHAHTLSAKKDLIREGDQPGPVFVMLEGWACRYKILPSGSRQILAFLMPGDSCDLHAGLLAEMDHSIQTVTPSVVAMIARDEMDALMTNNPNVAKAMYISQLVDEGTMRAWITSMGRRSSIERVAHLMCELNLRARNIGFSLEASHTLPLSQILFADALGMTPVHLNRILKDLRDAGAMNLNRGSLVIANPRKLVSIAGFDENYLHRRLWKGP